MFAEVGYLLKETVQHEKVTTAALVVVVKEALAWVDAVVDMAGSSDEHAAAERVQRRNNEARQRPFYLDSMMPGVDNVADERDLTLGDLLLFHSEVPHGNENASAKHALAHGEVACRDVDRLMTKDIGKTAPIPVTAVTFDMSHDEPPQVEPHYDVQVGVCISALIQ